MVIIGDGQYLAKFREEKKVHVSDFSCGTINLEPAKNPERSETGYGWDCTLGPLKKLNH